MICKSIKIDINECTLNTHHCDVDAICQNEIGSFNCTCKDGFVGDGKTCYSIMSPPTATPTAAATIPPNGKAENNQAIGIGIGVTFGFLAFFLFSVLLMYLFKRQVIFIFIFIFFI